MQKFFIGMISHVSKTTNILPDRKESELQTQPSRLPGWQVEVSTQQRRCPAASLATLAWVTRSLLLSGSLRRGSGREAHNTWSSGRDGAHGEVLAIVKIMGNILYFDQLTYPPPLPGILPGSQRRISWTLASYNNLFSRKEQNKLRRKKIL